LPTGPGTVGRYVRWLLAAGSLAAGVVHFAVSGEHYDVSGWHGLFFAVVAWLQVSWAVAVVRRPARPLLVTGVVLNAGVLGMWVVSRVWGVPVGPDAWTPESVAFADALASALESVIVLCSIGVLVRPALAARPMPSAVGLPGVTVAALGVAVVSTLALTPGFASGHDHGERAAVSVGATPCGRSGEPVFRGQNPDAHNHRGPAPWQSIRDVSTRAEYAAEIELARDAAARFPTVQAAEAAGYRKLTPYLPCVGAHYVNDAQYVTGEFDPAAPPILIYDGTRPASSIVGLSYVVTSDSAPEGFAGANDGWHTHSKFCVSITTGIVLGAEQTGNRKCAAAGGENIDLHRDWMMHAWVVPGWDSAWGIFSSEHPDLGGKNALAL
jgi:hypothetical protein